MKNIPLCTHIKDDGIRCGSPARRGHDLCYFHDRAYRHHSIARDAACKLIPVLKNDRDIRVATTNVLRAIRQGIFKPEDVKALLYGLQIARSALPPRRGRRRQDRWTLMH